MLPIPEVCERARLSRDARFDGRFVVGVLTTGIYCRPVCPARPPAPANVRYFGTSAAAQDAGFRPCLRCRPETARRLPEWTLGSETVIRGLRLIDGGFLDEHPVAALAARLQLGERHLNRLFQQELGATPKSLARTRRLHLAKQLIDQSRLPFAEIALHAGFGSVRRFNDEIRSAYRRSPRGLRQAGAALPVAGIELTLPVRLPYDAAWVFGFLEKRALAGIESVAGLCYRRRLDGPGGESGWLEVSWQNGALRVLVPGGASGNLGGLLARVRRLFDLGADSEVVDGHLAADPVLGGWAARFPGLRVPGAWDGFETAVRAILGQQVSVARATELAQRMVARYGDGHFPTPEQLMTADVAELGMPGQRGAAIRALAQAVAAGQIELDDGAQTVELTRALCELPGVGAWTAAYIAMRVLKDPDAFPDSDWVVLKMLNTTPARARGLAAAWQPWRAYAVMLLWRAAQERRVAEALAGAQKLAVTGQKRRQVKEIG